MKGFTFNFIAVTSTSLIISSTTSSIGTTLVSTSTTTTTGTTTPLVGNHFVQLEFVDFGTLYHSPVSSSLVNQYSSNVKALSSNLIT